MPIRRRRRRIICLTILIPMLLRVLVHAKALGLVVGLSVGVLGLAAAHHPAVVLEEGEVFAQAAAGVVVAADEVEED